MINRLTLLLFATAALALPPGAHGQTIYGYGTTTGGSGGAVIHVTTIDPLEDGSIKDALEAAAADPGPNIVRFDVSGEIDVSVYQGGELQITDSRLTIDGSTGAPGPVVLVGGTLVIAQSQDVIVTQLAVRPGDGLFGPPPAERDSIRIRGSQRVGIDHVSLQWSIDELLEASGFGPESVQSSDVTVQYSLLAEPFSCPPDPYCQGGDCPCWHPGGEHGYCCGAGRWAERVTFYRNVMALSDSRMARWATVSLADQVNNYIYGPKRRSTVFANGLVIANAVNNIYRRLDFSDECNPGGPSGCAFLLEDTIDCGYSAVYVAGNKEWSASFPWPSVDDDWNDLAGCLSEVRVSEPVAAPFNLPSIATAGPLLVNSLLGTGQTGVGARPGARDATDARIICLIQNGEGVIVNEPPDPTGCP